MVIKPLAGWDTNHAIPDLKIKKGEYFKEKVQLPLEKLKEFPFAIRDKINNTDTHIGWLINPYKEKYVISAPSVAYDEWYDFKDNPNINNNNQLAYRYYFNPAKDENLFWSKEYKLVVRYKNNYSYSNDNELIINIIHEIRPTAWQSNFNVSKPYYDITGYNMDTKIDGTQNIKIAEKDILKEYKLFGYTFKTVIANDGTDGKILINYDY